MTISFKVFLYQYYYCISRRELTDSDWLRAEQLGILLTSSKRKNRLSVQQLSDRAAIGYETVRSLLAGKSAGPSFFLVADLAEALGEPLGELAEKARAAAEEKEKTGKSGSAGAGR